MDFEVCVIFTDIHFEIPLSENIYIFLYFIDSGFFSLRMSLKTSSKHYCLSFSDLRPRFNDQEENWTQTEPPGILYTKLLIAL